MTLTAVMDGFKAKLTRFLTSTQIITDYSKRYAYGTDASFYRLTPKMIVMPDNAEQMVKLIKTAREFKIAITFRAAGTSVSGQAVTDSVLVLLSDQWTDYRIADGGKSISLQPSIIGAKANQLLAKYHRKIGPDPASINSCKIGGIAANNSSGMCCGVKQNSYHTVADIKLILADGSELDTSCEQSKQAFLNNQTELVGQISRIAEQAQSDHQLAQLIRKKYRLKNTTGYGINALVDFDDPIDIIKHLMIGSEGTLAFISEITYHTVLDEQNKATGFYVFDDMTATCHLVSQLANLPVSAVELMDKRALDSVADQAAMPAGIAQLGSNSAALLIEIAGETPKQLQSLQQQVVQLIDGRADSIVAQIAFTQDKTLATQLWNIRKGTFPAVGAVREIGSTVIIEDIAVPVADLADGVAALHQLFDQYQYDEAIIFGHALDGNLHFVFTQSFAEQAQIDRYDAFMRDVAELVAVRFGGSLKAEHGTGRNMAPFVKTEWGDAAYQLMLAIKHAFDPDNLLNPGVIINDDPKAHLTALKAMPSADSIIDKCIECGFCEAVCPSQGLTLTPRQRIVIWRRIMQLEREIASAQPYSAKSEKLKAEHQTLKTGYQDLGIDSCAATGLCGLRCPVGINTGEFIKSLRAEQLSPMQKRVMNWSHANFSVWTGSFRVGLNVVSGVRAIIGDKALTSSSKWLSQLSEQRIPTFYPAIPTGGDKIIARTATLDKPQVIYLPTCGGRLFAQDKQTEPQRTLSDTVISVLEKAGFTVTIPDNANDDCCGQPFASKGAEALAQSKGQALLTKLEKLSQDGQIPVLFDASPCALQLESLSSTANIYESAEFIQRFVIDKLQITPSEDTIALHVTCSSKRRKSENALLEVAKRCAKTVVVPADIECCGFAGDKGLLYPALNDNALKTLPQAVKGCSAGYSNSRTCEIGLTKNSGILYQSVFYLLDEVSVKTE